MQEKQQCVALFAFELRIDRKNVARLFMGKFQKIAVHVEPHQFETRHAGLLGAKHVALAAQMEIFLGDPEPVLRLAQDGDARLGRLPERSLVEQEAEGFFLTAPDPATQLMQLREAETLGLFDDHDVGSGHVDSHFDHRGGDENSASCLRRRTA